MKRFYVVMTVLAITSMACFQTANLNNKTEMVMTESGDGHDNGHGNFVVELPQTPTPGIHANTEIVGVIAELVNIRDSSHNATGKLVSKGYVLEVVWEGDWGKIVFPSELEGYYIWRGCTSSAGNLGCANE